MRKTVLGLVVFALALMTITAPASAREVTRPFKATFSGATTDIVYAPGFDFASNPTATSTFNGRCPGGASWVISFAGHGHGTHLGSFTWSSSHCTRLTSLTPPNAVITDGEFHFESASGDALHETYIGVGPLTSEGDLLCADTAATFAGGTGRFQQATGSALEHGCWPASTVGPVLSDLWVSSVGTITFDASGRS